jgi:hypothetical protein
MSKANGGASEASSSAVAVQAYYQDEENLKKLCNFLRTKHGPAIREATLMEKRVYYLKGTDSETRCSEPQSLIRVIGRVRRHESQPLASCVAAFLCCY